MEKTTILAGIQHVIDHAVSVSRPAQADTVVPSALEAGITIPDIFSICLEHSTQYKTYGVKFGANVGRAKKHYRYQIPTEEAEAWNTLIFNYTQLSHSSRAAGFNILQTIKDEI